MCIQGEPSLQISRNTWHTLYILQALLCSFESNEDQGQGT